MEFLPSPRSDSGMIKTMAARQTAVVVLVAACLPWGACDKPSACEEDVTTIVECGRVFQQDICAIDMGDCYAACYARVSCGDWPRIDRSGPPPWLDRCLASCWQPFVCDDGAQIDSYWRCDGAEDCEDGADEAGACQYYECKNGQRARSDALCDGYVACADGSDEAECP